jgi:arogenate dehydrogenase (NADP+)
VFPKNLLLTKLPASCDILCLHPMFGPESGKNAWTGLPLVYDRVRVSAPAQCLPLHGAAAAPAELASCASQVGDDPARERRCSNFLRSFEVRLFWECVQNTLHSPPHVAQAEGCRMVEMTCEEHDKLAASSQFITHTVGRMLGRMELPDTPINTRGYESLLSLVRNTTNDSFDLYYGLFMYNEVRSRACGLGACAHVLTAARRTQRRSWLAWRLRLTW